MTKKNEKKVEDFNLDDEGNLTIHDPEMNARVRGLIDGLSVHAHQVSGLISASLNNDLKVKFFMTFEDGSKP